MRIYLIVYLVLVLIINIVLYVVSQYDIDMTEDEKKGVVATVNGLLIGVPVFAGGISCIWWF
jgi:hypothetical protein